MRPLQEWDETDLQKLIDDQLQESLQLDYKQSEALSAKEKCRTDLAKDVSAFANSAGGRIIYGIAEKDRLPVSIDGGVDPAIITREWIENIIISKIQPRIPSLVIKPISLSGGGIAYVIDIPQATTFAPHQAEYRYYKRYNFQSVPMEDYEIKDAMRRASSNEPFITFKCNVSKIAENSEQIELQAVIGNRSPEPMLYGTTTLIIDQLLFGGEQRKVSGWSLSEDIGVLNNSPDEIPFFRYNKNHIVPHVMPIFKETEFLLFKVAMPVPKKGDYLLGYGLACAGYSGSVASLVHFDGKKLISLNEENADLVRA